LDEQWARTWELVSIRIWRAELTIAGRAGSHVRYLPDFVEEVGVAAAHTQGERDQPGLIRFMLAAVPASG
jgi:hypothetical protein